MNIINPNITHFKAVVDSQGMQYLRDTDYVLDRLQPFGIVDPNENAWKGFLVFDKCHYFLQNLANYLKKLMTDDELYLSYFRWREYYIVDIAPIKTHFVNCVKCWRIQTSKPKHTPTWALGGLERRSIPWINHTCMYSPPKSLVFNPTG